MSFDPDKFIAENTPQQQEAPASFDPDKFIADHEPENPHDLVPFLKAQGKGFVDLAKQAGSGISNAVQHPLDTIHNVVDSASGVDGEGVYRAVRNIPLVGSAVDNIAGSGKALYGMLGNGANPEEGEKALKQYKDDQAHSDIAHEREHPLTDFIQKSAGLVALPEGHMAQVGTMSVDAFSKSLDHGNDIITALKDARNAGILTSMALTTGKMISSIPSKIGQYAAREAGVTDNAISRYRENPEAVNSAAQYVKDPEALKNLVDNRIGPVLDEVGTAQTGVENARSALQDARSAVADTRQPPISLASEIPEHLDTQGAKLHDLSSQAFDILHDEGHSFPVANLSDAVSKQMQSLEVGGVVPSIGPDAAAYGALGKFKEMVNQIGNNAEGGEIPAPIVKKLIQQLDGVSKDAYTTNAGALSPSAAQNLASVRRTFDQAIKEASPAYAEKMAELSPQVQIVSDMSKVFGNEQLSLNALKAAADPMTPRGHVVRNKLAQYDAMNGTDFLQRVADYYDKPREALDIARSGVSDAQNALIEKQAAAAQVNKIGPNSTETVLKSIENGHNIEARKQLETFDPELSQTVKDAGVAKQFSKSTTNGSRKAKIGAGVGGAAGAALGGFGAGPIGAVVGGHIGGGIGGFAGGLADLYGGQAVKAALDAGIKIEKLANTPYIGTIMKAAQESPKALAVTHYMLNQTDPKYQQISNSP